MLELSKQHKINRILYDAKHDQDKRECTDAFLMRYRKRLQELMLTEDEFISNMKLIYTIAGV